MESRPSLSEKYSHPTACPRGSGSCRSVAQCCPTLMFWDSPFGIRYGDMLGHRGITHSLPCALMVACLAAWLCLDTANQSGRTWPVLVGYFFIVTASHGLLDAMTNGGLGVAFFAPFSNNRYFLPWQPIEVSPIGLDFFFSARALAVLWSEIKWIWIPSAVVIVCAQLIWNGLKR